MGQPKELEKENRTLRRSVSSQAPVIGMRKGAGFRAPHVVVGVRGDPPSCSDELDPPPTPIGFQVPVGVDEPGNRRRLGTCRAI